MTLDEVIEAILRLEREREEIYSDSQVTADEHPRLAEVVHELNKLWDLRRRFEAARAAGLDHIPVLPTREPEDMEG